MPISLIIDIILSYLSIILSIRPSLDRDVISSNIVAVCKVVSNRWEDRRRLLAKQTVSHMTEVAGARQIRQPGQILQLR